MSTFNGLVCEINGVSLDCFEKQNLDSRVFFLSHCHTDHYRGISSSEFLDHLKRNDCTIYASEISCIIISNIFPSIKDFVKPLCIGEIHTITVPASYGNKDKLLNVTLIPAGHCPGSVMFLFNTHDNKTILCTGDFRIDPKDINKIRSLKKDNVPIAIDKMYLDTTFWDKSFSFFPSREESCKILCGIIEEWLNQHKDNIVNLVISANIGIENLYKDIYNKLQMPICIKDLRDFLVSSYRQIAELENIFTLDKNVRIFSSRSYNNDKRARNIRISAMKWRKLQERDLIYSKNSERSYSVCYSSHCSYEELKGFLKHFGPKTVYPCVTLNVANLKLLEDFLMESNCIDKESNMQLLKDSSNSIQPKPKYIACSFYDSD